MTQPSVIQAGFQKADPSLKDLLNSWKTDVMLATNCHAIATIQDVQLNDNGLITVTAVMNYTKTFFLPQQDGTYLSTQVSYPTMVDVPVIILGGGTVGLTFPIAAGDECLILFNDRDLNNWFAGATSGPVATPRLHSFADGIALVGFHRLTAWDQTHAKLSNGNAQVGVPTTGGKVSIANTDTTLNTLLGNLITAINNITTTNAVVGSPCLISPASQLVLSNIATQLGDLLE